MNNIEHSHNQSSETHSGWVVCCSCFFVFFVVVVVVVVVCFCFLRGLCVCVCFCVCVCGFFFPRHEVWLATLNRIIPNTTPGTHTFTTQKTRDGFFLKEISLFGNLHPLTQSTDRVASRLDCQSWSVFGGKGNVRVYCIITSKSGILDTSLREGELYYDTWWYTLQLPFSAVFERLQFLNGI